MSQRYEVQPYSINTLKELLGKKSGASERIVSDKFHTHYFENYFRDLKAETIIVENEYVDSHYLEDYTGYYAKCFKPYNRFCTRLHFFTALFDKVEFDRLLFQDNGRNLDLNQFRESYLGYIVVKPLPETFVGRTCLITYPPLEDCRYFPSTRHYEANLFGIGLEVRTIAFQEQDTVAAACATSALWSAFQGTGTLFHHHIPSPVEITMAATQNYPGISRTFPNDGLNPFQMAQAIRNVGLEPFSLEVRENYITTSHVYAYLKGKVPVLMLGAETDKIKHDEKLHSSDLSWHAIAATGFRLGNDLLPYGDAGFLLKASRITSLYAHDDQVGPFCKMALEDKKVTFSDSRSMGCLSIFYGPNRSHETLFIPTNLLIPLEQSIRIPFEIVLDSIISFDSVVEAVRQSGFIDLAKRIEWDIYLISINDLKTEVHKEIGMSFDSRCTLQLASLPKFVWRATGTVGSNKLLDLIFDTTDIEQGPLILQAVFYDLAIQQHLLHFARTYISSGLEVQDQSKKLWEHLAHIE